MVELARWAPERVRITRLDLAFLFFVREELPTEESALPRVFAEAPLVLESDLVVVLEPTDNAIHAGCLGEPERDAVVPRRERALGASLAGRERDRRGGEGLAPVVAVEPLEVEVGGLTVRRGGERDADPGGIADNVIPDRVDVQLNYRYAPNRTPEEAEARLRELVGGDVELEITSNSPPARVATDSQLVERLRDAGGLAVEPKQAWTPVAEFSAQGLDAVNLGPGATRMRTAATSGSRSPSSSGRSRRSGAFVAS